jgi:3,4-dihydroxy 2-butanone 4-phosphate synthase
MNSNTSDNNVSSSLKKAIQALKKGKFIIIHDFNNRENESDFVCLAEKITPSMVRQMRKDGGGLICVAIDSSSQKRLGIPFAIDLFSENKELFEMANKKMKYGDFPSFTISINHKDTFTGITDFDRAKTIKEFGKLIAKKAKKAEFQKNFRAIGHVFLLASRGLENRRGHTELSVALAEYANLTPALAICEILSDSGKAASFNQVKKYAKKHNIPFIEGKDVVSLFQNQKITK